MASIDRKVQRAAVAKQTKKTRAENNTAAKTKVRAARASKENDEPLPPEVEARLSEIVAQVVSLHRKSTAQVFELGECLAEAKSVQPEKRFGKWLKESCNYTVRSAWNFISVHERLGDHRARLEEHAVGTTALFELAKGEPDQINTVLDAYDEGKSLTGAEIKAIVSKKEEGTENVDPLHLGGKLGLQKLSAAKHNLSVPEFWRLTAGVLQGIEKAVERFGGGQRIVMTTLAHDVQSDARQASDLFRDIALPLRRAKNQPLGNLYHENLERSAGWGAVEHALYRLGGAGSWPVRDEMEKWVVEVAHPALRFAVHGEPYVAGTEPAAAPIHDVIKADSDVAKDDEAMVEKATDVIETMPSVSEAELDATLNSLMSASKTPAEVRMPR